MRHHSLEKAFTLVEVLVVVSIILVLAVLATPTFSGIIDKAQGVQCSSKLRNLWVMFSGSLTDGEGWPQLPQGIQAGSMEEQQWWLDYSIRNLGMKENDWKCPSIMRRVSGVTNSAVIPKICYFPTLFDANPATPRLWPRMPWFTEMASLHGKGNLSVRADGSVCSVRDP